MVILENTDKPGTFLVRNAPKALQEKLKFAIPSNSRLFTEEGWIVQETYLSQVEYWCKTYHLPFSSITKQSSKESYYKVLHLLPSAPDFVVDATWKVLARKYHPDSINGNQELFLTYKQAFDKIRG